MKIHKIFITVFTSIHWVKPAQPVEPILLTSTLLIGGPAGRRRLVQQIKKQKYLLCYIDHCAEVLMNETQYLKLSIYWIIKLQAN